MAVRTVSNTGGNWNSTATWVGGVVPVAGDSVNFTSTSGNLVVNVLTAVLSGIDFSNYLGTITFTNGITSNGIINLGTGGYTQAGAAGLYIGNSGTATLSGTAVWSRVLQFQGTNVTTTLANDITVTGTVSMNATTSHVINGNILNIQGNLSVISTATISGTTAFVLNGTGTWNHTAAGAIRNNLTINTAGTITIGTNVYYNTGTLTYTAGSLSLIGSTINIGASTTLALNGVTWSNNFTLSATSTITLSNNLTFSGTLSATAGTITFAGAGSLISSSGSLSITGSAALTVPTALSLNTLTIGSSGTTTLKGDLTCSGLVTLGVTTTSVVINNDGTARTIIASNGITMAGTTSIVSGSVNIQISSGTITGVSSVQLRNNLEIIGSITFASGVSFLYNTGTLKYTSGTVTTTNSTLTIGASTILDTNGITWNNLTINAASTLTLTTNLTFSGTLSATAGTITFAGVGALISSSGAVSITGTAAITIPNGLTITTLTVTSSGTTVLKGDITCSGLVSLGVNGVTTTINNDGTTRTITATNGLTTNGTTSAIVSTINIKVTGGTITGSGLVTTGGYLQSNFEIDGDVIFSGTFYHYGGASGTLTFTYTSGIVTTTGTTITFNASVVTSGTIAWNNVQIRSGGSVACTLKSDMIVNGLLTLGYLTAANSINNDGTTRTITVAGGISMSGTTSIVSGTANIKITGGTITGVSSVQLRNNLEIDGNVTFASGVSFLYNTGTLKYTSGTVTTTNSTLTIGVSTTLDTNGITWNNLTVSASSTLTIPSNLSISGTFSATAGTITFSGVGILSITGPISLTGTSAVTFPNALTPTTFTATTSGTTVLKGDITCSGLVNLGVNGVNTIINNDGTTRTLIATAGLTISGATSFITGSANFKVTGGTITGSGALSTGGYISVNFDLDGNVTFANTGTFYYYGGAANIYTFTYTSGTITTTGSSVIFNTATLINVGSITWNNVWIGSGGGTTILKSDMTVNGLLTLGFTTSSCPINNDGSTRTITASGGITLSGTTSIISGTANIKATGGTITGVSSVQLRNNLEIDGNVTFASGVSFLYNTGILKYTSGTVTVTNSTLTIGASTTLDTSGMSWNNVVMTSGTQTLSSDFNIGGNLTTQTSAIVINGAFNVNLIGNLTINIATSGLATIIINGTGAQTWAATSFLSNNLTINKSSGTLTVSGNVYYSTGTLTYTASSVTTTGSTLNLGSCTLATNGITWNNILSSNAGTTTITLSSNLSFSGTLSLLTTTAGTVTFSGVGTLSPTSVANVSLGHENFGGGSTGSSTINFPSSTVLSITNLTVRCGGATSIGYNTTANNVTFNISGNLSLAWVNQDISRFNGTSSQINMVGTGTLTANRDAGNSLCYIVIPFNVNTSETITLSGNVSAVYFETTTITYTTGTITGVVVVFITCTLNLNNGGKWGTDVVIRGNTTLTSNATFGNLTTNITAVVFSGAFTVNVEGNLAINITTSGTSTPIILNGTGAQTWTHGSAVYLSNNLTINKASGTLTLGANVYYVTGTLTYTTGTVDTTTNNSVLNINASTTLDTDRGATKINFNNVNIAGAPSTITLSSNLNTTNLTITNGTVSFSLGGNSLNVSTNFTLSTAAAATLNLPSDLQINNLIFSTAGISTISGLFNLYVSGNLTVNGTNNTAGTGTIVLNGTGTWSHSSTAVLRNNLTIDTTGTTTVSGNVYYHTGTLKYLQGDVITTNSALSNAGAGGATYECSGITWYNFYSAGAVTLTLNENLNVSNFIALGGGTLTLTINGNKIYCGGDFDIGVSTSSNSSGVITGTAEIVMNGTGTIKNNGTTAKTLQLRNNLTIDTTGTTTFSGVVYYNTRTLKYVQGDVVTTGSTLLVGTSATLDTNGIIWENITMNGTSTITLSSLLNLNGLLSITGSVTFSGAFDITTLSLTISGSITVTLSSNINASGNVNLGVASTTTTINGVSFAIISSGTVNLTQASGYVITGSATLKLTGGVFNGINSSLYTNDLRLNLDIDGDVTFGSSSTTRVIFYSVGRIRYLSGNIDTTTWTLLLSLTGTCSMQTNGMTWHSIRLIASANMTLTLNNDLYVNYFYAGYVTYVQTINSNKVYCQNLTIGWVGGDNTTSVVNGTSEIVLNGTGTWFNDGAVGFNKTAQLRNNLTIDTTGVLTISGTVYYNTGTLKYVQGDVNVQDSTLFIGLATTLDTNVMGWNNVTIGSTDLTVTLSSNLLVNGLFTNTTILTLNGGYTLTLNGGLRVERTMTTTSGSPLIDFKGGTWVTPNSPSNGVLSVNMNINGNITISGVVMYGIGTLTYISGKPKTINSTLRIMSNTTILNFNKLNLHNVVVVSGIVLTMNEFFCGAPSLKTNISASSTTNYTISFRDNTEKFAFNVKIANATVTNRGQLTVLTNRGNNLNNVGIKFAPNQLPNGLSKNNPLVSNQSQLSSFLSSEPIYN